MSYFVLLAFLPRIRTIRVPLLIKLCFTSDIFSDTTHAAEHFFSSRFLLRNRNSGRYRKQLHAYCTRRCIIAAARELALLIFILLFSTMPLITTPCPPLILGGRENERKGWARFHRPCTLRRWLLPCNFILINLPFSHSLPPSVYRLRYSRSYY